MKMKILLLFLIGFLPINLAFAIRNGRADQDVTTVQRPTDFISAVIYARRNELRQLVKFYSIDIDKADWNYKQESICPAFSRYFFIRYHNAAEPRSDFIAIYPRAAGRIEIVRQSPEYSFESANASLRNSTITTFNNVWSDQQRGLNSKIAVTNIDWIDVGRCYAEIAGEQLADVPDSVDSDTFGRQHHPEVKSGEIFKVEIGVLGVSPAKTTLSIQFDRQGSIKSVDRTESEKPSLVLRP